MNTVHQPTQEDSDYLQTTQTRSNESQDANRYTTVVLVECYIDNRLRKIKWFSDLQQAYMWCIKKIDTFPEEFWRVDNSFLEFADVMDRRWQEGRRNGYTIAESLNIKYRAYYEPNVDRNTIMSY
jgi:hypothetical protein